MRAVWALLCAAALIVGATPSNAEPIADFYRGKTLRILIGYGPGGGYDIYGRLVAEFLPRFIPGSPIIMPQNMPGAGSFAAAKFMAEAAPKDGTVLGTLAQTLALDSIVNPANGVDVTRFSYLGRVTTNVDIGAALPRTGILPTNPSAVTYLNVMLDTATQPQADGNFPSWGTCTARSVRPSSSLVIFAAPN